MLPDRLKIAALLAEFKGLLRLSRIDLLFANSAVLLMIAVGVAGCATTDVPSRAQIGATSETVSSSDTSTVARSGSDLDSLYWARLSSAHQECAAVLDASWETPYAQTPAYRTYFSCMKDEAEVQSVLQPLSQSEVQIAETLQGRGTASGFPTSLLVLAKEVDPTLINRINGEGVCPSSASPLLAIAMSTDTSLIQEAREKRNSCVERAAYFARVLVRHCGLQQPECRQAGLDYAAASFLRWRKARQRSGKAQ